MKIRSMLVASVAAVAALVLATSGCRPGEREAAQPGTAPSTHTARPPAVDEYHGVKVVDPYRWLEDSKDPEVAAWSREQTARARAALDAMPSIARIRERLTDLMARGSVSYRDLEWAGGRLFALKSRPPLEQPLLVAMTSADDPASEVVLLDPNALDPKGTTSIDFFEPAFDGSLVAVSVSTGGSESGDVHVYEVPSGRRLGDVVPRVNGGTAGGSVAWNGDGTGFYYTRYPRAGERPDAAIPPGPLGRHRGPGAGFRARVQSRSPGREP